MPRQRRVVDKMPATSTPNAITGRRSIHKDKTISPILNDNNIREKHVESSLSSNSSSELSETEESYGKPSRERIEKYKSNVQQNKLEKLNKESVFKLHEGKIFIITGLLIGMISAFMLADKTQKADLPCDFMTVKTLQEKFPSQSQYTFDAIISGINEVKMFNKPSIFILLHGSDSRQTVDDFVQVVAHYAVNVLNDECSANPIILTSSSLNTPKAKSDYGHIISTYKPALEKRTVMIVKNLEKVSGFVAQAFHTICDEFSPLVPKSLIIFTMEIKNKSSNTYKSDYQLVETILRGSWSELDDDTFYPLCTRITSMVLKIEPEKK